MNNNESKIHQNESRANASESEIRRVNEDEG
jgi:hypothetical protein